MCRATARGTRSSIGWPAASRVADRRRRDVPRPRLHEKDAGFAGQHRAASAGWRMRGRSCRRPRQRRVERRARPRDDREVRRVEHVGELAPGGNFCKRVGAEDEENLRRLPALRVQRAQRVDVYDAPVRGPASMSETRYPDGRSAIASATSAKRWNAVARGSTGRCGGSCDGTNTTSSRPSADCAASPASRCPK